MKSIEQALLANAYPHVLAAKAREMVEQEACKGCEGHILPQPVCLEPLFQPIVGLRDPEFCLDPIAWRPDALIDTRELVTLKIWVSPEQRSEWNRSELFLKSLSSARCRLVFEIVGNIDHIDMYIRCDRHDLFTLKAVFSGQFESSELSEVGNADLLRATSLSMWDSAIFRDYFPYPPYSHLMTRPEELVRSPHTTLLASLAAICPPHIGCYQVVFAPVSAHSNWHDNVRALLDLEYKIKLIGGVTAFERYAQQVPSGDLRQMAMDAEEKANNDKPFFAAALRIGVLGEQRGMEPMLEALCATSSVIQHGGRALRSISGDLYRDRFSTAEIRAMFLHGLTYRTGFLVNSEELTTLVHVPQPEVLEHLSETVTLLDTLRPHKSLDNGVPLGTCNYAGSQQTVCIPTAIRKRHVHVIGGTGIGKSTLLEHMILHDIREGHGVAVLDPHGTLIERLLLLIPESAVDRVIHFNPGDRDWVPLWNPLQISPHQDIGRTADDLVCAFKKVVDNWGDRLENLLRQGFYALLNMPGSTMLDLSNLMRNTTPESKERCKQILQVVDSELAIEFWDTDFPKFGKDDLGPPKNKLSKLLLSGTAALMLSQPECRFTFDDVMEHSHILLVDLSSTGSQVREVLGCFILSLLHQTAMRRNKKADARRIPCDIYCDEAHRFVTDAVEDLINETRKRDVSLVLAHQQLSQFERSRVDALSSVGSTIMFRVDQRDATYLGKDLQDKVEAKDLTKLGLGDAIARIDNHIVRLKTFPPLNVPAHHSRERIIARSRELYCRPAREVAEGIRMRRKAALVHPCAAGWPGTLVADRGAETCTERKKPPVDRNELGEVFDFDSF